ncbi:MAG: hypothetical protein R2695_00395 [Acidimicrobiales bacterium]
MVVGYDARHGSADFRHRHAWKRSPARRCTIPPRALPTPVLAFTVRHLDASAGVMVTASHNPRDDNGYKVYGRGGALLTAPFDARIADAMRRLPLPLRQRPRSRRRPSVRARAGVAGRRLPRRQSPRRLRQ